MTSPELENLVRIGQLKREPAGAGEIERLVNDMIDAAKAVLSALQRAS